MTDEGKTLPPIPPPNVNKEEHFEVPEYLESVYRNSYFRPVFARIMDDDWTAQLTTFFQVKKLIRCVTDEIFEGNDVLQLGLASGSLESEIAAKMNAHGHYDIEDISPAHIDAASPRLAPWLNTEVKERDITVPTDKRYQVVVCFFLLHELPDARKKAVIDRALNSLTAEGRVIFIDYAHPSRLNPFKYLVKYYNRLNEPFAESLWHNEIESFAPKSDKFIWDKKTFFGGMYQCVIAQKK